jgi:hypothetical protein
VRARWTKPRNDFAAATRVKSAIHNQNTPSQPPTRTLLGVREIPSVSFVVVDGTIKVALGPPCIAARAAAPGRCQSFR